MERIEVLKEKDQSNELQIKNLMDQMNELKTLIGGLKPLKSEEEKSIIYIHIKEPVKQD